MSKTTFLQYYPNGSSTYVPQRRISDENGGRRPSLSEMMSERSKMDERRKSEVVSEKAAALGGIQSLRQGKLPTNEQLDKIINRLIQSRAIENNQRYMSTDGQVLLRDFKELLLVFQRALKTKNRDELFQSMIYHVRRSEEAYQRDHSNSSSSNGDLREDVRSGAGAILKIAKLLLFNTQFKTLLGQMLTIAQQTLGVTLQQQGGKMINDNNSKVDSSALSKKKLVGHSSSIRGSNTNEVEPPSLKKPHSRHIDRQKSTQHGRLPGDHYESLSNRFSKTEPQPLFPTDGTGQLTDNHGASTDITQGFCPSTITSATTQSDQGWSGDRVPLTVLTSQLSDTSKVPFSTHSKITQDATTTDQFSLDKGDMANTGFVHPTAQVPDSRLQGALASDPRTDCGYLNSASSPSPAAQVPDSDPRHSLVASTVKSREFIRLGPKKPDNGSATTTTHMEPLDSTNIGNWNTNSSDHQPPAVRVSTMKQKDDIEEEGCISTKEIVVKLKDIVTLIQQRPEYQDAMSTLLSLFGVWGQRIRTGSGGMDRRRSSAVAAPEQYEYYKNTATFEAKTIIEDWAGGHSLDPILQQLYHVSSKLNKDKRLHGLFEKVSNYVKRLLQEPGYVASDESTLDGSKLVDQVKSSAIEEYKPHVSLLLQQSNDIIKAISQDDISQEISNKFKDIHKHLWFDGKGNASFKPQLLNDMRVTLLPAVIEQIKYLPLPKIVYSDKQYEIAVENMVLEGDTLMPDVFEIKVDDFLKFSPYAKMDYNNSQSLNIHMSGIHTTMHDVIFYYKRKTGFPKMSDSGVISLTTGGSGLRISMRITSSSWDQYRTFKVDQCHVHIDKLDIKVSSCKHNLMYRVFNPVLTGIIKRQMCKTMEKKMMTMLETGDEKLTKYLRISKQHTTQENVTSTTSSGGRPGVFSHLINILNQKIVSAI